MITIKSLLLRDISICFLWLLWYIISAPYLSTYPHPIPFIEFHKCLCWRLHCLHSWDIQKFFFLNLGMATPIMILSTVTPEWYTSHKQTCSTSSALSLVACFSTRNFGPCFFKIWQTTHANCLSYAPVCADNWRLQDEQAQARCFFYVRKTDISSTKVAPIFKSWEIRW